MNYVSVVCCGVILFMVGLWFTSKKGSFAGPRIDMDRLTESRLATIKGVLTGGIAEESASVEPGMKMQD